MRSWLTLLKKTIWDFMEHDCMSQAAALAYYTVFSLPPLLAVVVGIAGAVSGMEAVQRSIQVQARGLV